MTRPYGPAEIDAILGTEAGRLRQDREVLRQELTQERAKVIRVHDVLAAAEERIRHILPPDTAERIIEEGDVEIISIRDIRWALEDER